MSSIFSDSRRVTVASLLAIALAFLIVRLPVMYRQPGGQDEDCYAVPGLTILQNGVPRLPHVPARNPESVYYRADDALFAEPPLYFYSQALFYAVLPDEWGTARLSSTIAGLVGLAILYRVARECGVGVIPALLSMGLFSVCRWFYFPAITARPDMLCALFGFATVASLFAWQRTQQSLWWLLAGICLGLGGLTHPFAIVYAVQAAVWLAWTSKGWLRVGRPLALAATAIVVFSAWLPLILAYPEACWMQWRNQFSNEAGGPIWLRLLMPWESLAYHAAVLWGFAGVVQFVLPILALAGCTVAGWRSKNAALNALAALCWSSLFLLAAAVGSHHRVNGYWVYAVGLMFVCLGWTLGAMWQRCEGSRWRRSAATSGLTCVFLLMLPGMGLRTWWVHVSRWNDINYDAPRFARRLMESLPAEAVYAVDTQLALDFIVAGRRTLLAQELPFYFRVDQFPFDYLIVSRYGRDTQIAHRLGDELVRTHGIEGDPFACFAEVYARRAAE